jgi:hypothetical protein
LVRHVDECPADLDVVRYWDLAATEKTELNDPDWTVGIKLGRDRNGGFWLLDMVRARANPGDTERLLLNTATQDGKRSASGSARIRGWPARARRITWCVCCPMARNRCWTGAAAGRDPAGPGVNEVYVRTTIRPGAKTSSPTR